MLPALGCAVCPACLSLWKPLLSVLGVTLAFSDEQHAWLLFVSLSLAFSVGAWDARRSGVQLPFWLTVGGGSLLILSHLTGELAALEWSGMFIMACSVPTRMWLRSRHRHQHVVGS